MTRFLAIAAAILAFAGIAGCGEDGAGDQTVSTSASAGTDTPDESTTDGGEEAPSGGSGDAVAIVDFKYDPEPITVSAGTTVTWTNEDSAPHTATADDQSFDTGNLGQGDEGEVTLDDPGEYSYFCVFHPFMKGTVIVE